jgi:hypothetical protein
MLRWADFHQFHHEAISYSWKGIHKVNHKRSLFQIKFNKIITFFTTLAHGEHSWIFTKPSYTTGYADCDKKSTVPSTVVN